MLQSSSPGGRKIALANADGSQLVTAWADYRFDTSGEGYYNDLFYNHFPAEESDPPAWSDEDMPLKSLKQGTSFTEGLHINVIDNALVAVWIDGRNGNRDVFFSRVEIGLQVDSLDLIAQAAAASGR